jgi:endogenous inhibitor of DNA gyrase (YacG/DUF329 family)
MTVTILSADSNPCPVCNGPIEGTKRGRPKKFCSVRCRSKKARQLSAELSTAPCVVCGGPVDRSKSGGRRKDFCSTRCRDKNRLMELRSAASDQGLHVRGRRTKEEMAEFRQAIVDILNGVHPQTVRQVFYQLVVKEIIKKSEREYKAVIRMLTQMRMDDTIPFEWLIDEMHRRETYRTYDSLADAARDTARHYRRNALNECPDYIEIFVGKQALVGFVHEAAGEYDVPIIPVGTSLSQLWESANCIRNAWRRAGKRSFIYQFDDFDATALVHAASTERRLKQLCAKLNCPPPTVERVALTPEQIEEHRLPSRPSKTFAEGNKHAKSVNFQGESTELDALPAAILQGMVTEVLERHISPEQLEVLREAERSERQILRNWAERMETEGGDDDDDDDDDEE